MLPDSKTKTTIRFSSMKDYKTLKNTRWNRLFHPRIVKKNKDRAHQLRMLTNYDYMFTTYDMISHATSLYTLLDLHKSMWRSGYRNQQLGPSPHGIFRCQNILTMYPNQIFLGGVNDTPIHSMFWFVDHRHNTEMYNAVLYQYKHILLKNLQQIYREYKEELSDLENNNY